MHDGDQTECSKPTSTQTDTNGKGLSLVEIGDTGHHRGDVHQAEPKPSDNAVGEDEEEDVIDKTGRQEATCGQESSSAQW